MARATARQPASEPIDGFERFCGQIGRIDVLPPHEVQKLAARIQRGDQRARTELVEANLRLVVMVAKRLYYLTQLAQSRLEVEDLVSVGVVQLQQKIHKFDPTKGAFSTWAYTVAYRAMKRAIFDSYGSIRLPAKLRDGAYTKIEATHARLEAEKRLPASSGERIRVVAEATSIDEDLVRQGLEYKALKQESLDYQSQHDDSERGTRSDHVADASISTEEEAERNIAIDELMRRLESLPPETQTVIRLKYGCGGCRPQTHAEIARLLGIPASRVPLIARAGLDALQDSYGVGTTEAVALAA